MKNFYTTFLTPLGWCGIVKGSGGLLRIFLPEPNRVDLRKSIRLFYPCAQPLAEHQSEEIKALQHYFAGNQPHFTFTLDLGGASAFQKRVWQAVRQVAYGQVRTYRWVAEKIQKPYAARAVGNALGNNPLPIVIPCHRIVRSDGALGGFTASKSSDLKADLLTLEGVKADHRRRVKSS